MNEQQEQAIEAALAAKDAEIARLKADVERYDGIAVKRTQQLDAAESQLTSLQAAIARVEQALRTMARVAGQAAVEQLDPMLASADARFADYCTTWADTILAALTQRETPTP